jgi:hypothetical protein
MWPFRSCAEFDAVGPAQDALACHSSRRRDASRSTVSTEDEAGWGGLLMGKYVTPSLSRMKRDPFRGSCTGAT